MSITATSYNTNILTQNKYNNSVKTEVKQQESKWQTSSRPSTAFDMKQLKNKILNLVAV